MLVVIIDAQGNETFFKSIVYGLICDIDLLIFVCEKYNDLAAFLRYFKIISSIGVYVHSHFSCMRKDLVRLLKRETWLCAHASVFLILSFDFALTDELYKKQPYTTKLDVYQDFSFLLTR